jgi:hypothetical protein
MTLRKQCLDQNAAAVETNREAVEVVREPIELPRETNLFLKNALSGCESFRGPPPACDWLALFRDARTPSLAFPLAHANSGAILDGTSPSF